MRDAEVGVWLDRPMAATPAKPPQPPEPASPDSAVEERLANVLDGISDVYYAVDRAWRFTLFNRAAESFFGAKRAEMLGRNFWDVFPQGRGTEFGRLLEQAMEERKPGRMTAPSARKKCPPM